MSPQKNAQLHTLLSKAGLMEEKHSLVLQFTCCRTKSSRDMTDAEANELINWLHGQVPAGSNEAQRMNTMRRKIISMAYEMAWATPGDWKAAMQAINKFCSGEHGKYKKELNHHNYKELVQVTTQFNQLYMKHLKAV